MDVSFICATIERPDLDARFINSVRKFYQDIPIITWDRSRDQKNWRLFTKERMSNVFARPFIVALPVCAMIKAVKTEFILLFDNDFVFSDETVIDIPLQALKKFQEIGIVHGNSY